MTTSIEPIIRIRYGPIPIQLFGVVIAVGLSYFFWRGGISGIPAVVCFTMFTAILLICLTFGETRFQISPPRVFQQWRFLGIIPIWRTESSFGVFQGVQRQQHKYPNESGRPSSTWIVGLVRLHGGFLRIRYFNSTCDGPCFEANMLALQLAEITKLPLLETQVIENA